MMIRCRWGSGCVPSTRLVTAQTPIRLSPAPFGSSELIRYSALLEPTVMAGCTDAALWWPIRSGPMWTNVGDASPSTSWRLSITYSCAPLNTGRLIENSLVEM